MGIENEAVAEYTNYALAWTNNKQDASVATAKDDREDTIQKN